MCELYPLPILVLILYSRVLMNSNIMLYNDNDDDIHILVVSVYDLYITVYNKYTHYTRLIHSGPSILIGRTCVHRYNIISLLVKSYL